MDSFHRKPGRFKKNLDDTLDLYSKIGNTWTLTQTRPGFTYYGILVQCIVQVFSNSSRFSVKNVQVFSNLVQSSNVHVLPVPTIYTTTIDVAQCV